ncbi:GH25 family lysozyme [Parabacteroides sp. PFB2-10]|uniref:glycoside hydrolase family 25 protein n=1 Tax=Parabacteroides sp. PFB2-10 TaxID=1742405 RepID=UPI0024764082|nr:GH25 family lysozyme [Parabacteroides sp. PFB2-10]
MRVLLYIFVVLSFGAIFLSFTGEKMDAGYHGIDVSRHQRNIDWEQVSKDKNIQFVYIKATEGKTYIDPKYKYNIKEARKNKFKVGAYHYFRTTSSAHGQFENFKKTARKADQDLIPIVDVEERKNWTRSQFQDSLKVFIRLVKEHYGKAPMIYSVNSFYNANCAPEFNNYHAMIGRYNDDPTKHPTVKGKGTYTIWQFSEKGKIKGIKEPVDLNRFNPKYTIDDLLLK